MKKTGPGCGVPEKDESPQFEARNHSKQFLEKGCPSRRKILTLIAEAGLTCAVDAERFHPIYEKGEVAEA